MGDRIYDIPVKGNLDLINEPFYIYDDKKSSFIFLTLIDILMENFDRA